jgi:uncharacterized damage-inducible protein DinB
MKKALVVPAVLGILLAGLASPAAAQDPRTPSFSTKADILWQIKDAEKKLLQLAEATPAEKFAWRPAEGIRSTGEVFMHVAGANYFIPTFWGTQLPEGVNPREFEKQGANKAKVLETLKKSFEHARAAVEKMPDADLDKPIKLFGNDASARMAVLAIATHGHEHLGQSIAYARMNGITPPWSR